MQIRAAKNEDLPLLASIRVKAFESNAIYAHFWPRRHIYPTDYWQFFLDDLNKKMVTPGNIIMVVDEAAVKTDEEKFSVGSSPSNTNIIAFFTVLRLGTSNHPERWNPDNEHKQYQRKILELKEQHAPPNKAFSEEAYQKFYKQAKPLFDDLGGHKMVAETLAVLPDHQRSGVGQLITSWVIDLCRLEQVPVIADASEQGLPLYLRNGIKIIGYVVLPATLLTVKIEEGHYQDVVEECSTTVTLPVHKVPLIVYDPGRSKL